MIADVHTEPASGRVLARAADLTFTGSFSWGFSRAYSSARVNVMGALGLGWSHSLEQRIETRRGQVVRVDHEGEPRPLARDRSEGPIEIDDGRRRLGFDARGHLAGIRTIGGSVQRRDAATFVDDRGRWLSLIASGASIALVAGDGHTRRVIRTFVIESGLLVAVLDEHGERERYEYDRALLVAAHRRGMGATYFEYDGDDHLAKCTRIARAEGVLDRQILHGGERVLVEDQEGGYRCFVLGARARVNRVVEADGKSISFERDASGRICVESDETGCVWRRSYDRDARLNAVEASSGAVLVFEHGDHGPTRIGDATFAYDPHGRLVRAERGEARIEIVRGGAEPVRVRIDAHELDLSRARDHRPMVRLDGNEVRIARDLEGAIVRLELADEWAERRAGPRGEEIRYRDPSGACWSLQRSFDARLISLAEDGRTTSFHYDEGDLLVAYRSPGREIRVERDRAGAVRALHVDGESAIVTRDRAARVTRIASRSGEVMDVQRDPHGRIAAAVGAVARAGSAPSTRSRLPGTLPSLLAPLRDCVAGWLPDGFELPEHTLSDLIAIAEQSPASSMLRWLVAIELGPEALASFAAHGVIPSDRSPRTRTVAPLPRPIDSALGESPIRDLARWAVDLVILGSASPERRQILERVANGC